MAINVPKLSTLFPQSKFEGEGMNPDQKEKARVDGGIGSFPIGGKFLLIAKLHESIIAGSWTFNITQSHALNWYFTNTPNVNDGIRYKAQIRPGTYTIKILGRTTNAAGIIHISVDGVELTTMDTYAAADVHGVVFESTGVKITADGYVNIDFEMKTKNGASSGFYVSISAIEFTRTA